MRLHGIGALALYNATHDKKLENEQQKRINDFND